MPESEIESPRTTPLFLLWAIHHDCPVKQSLATPLSEPGDLLVLERTLRPLRSLALAQAEDRIHEDLCLRPPRTCTQHAAADFQWDQFKGFRISETLEAFGGEAFVATHCQGCPANVYRSVSSSTTDPDQRQYAGCYGYLQSSYPGCSLFEVWQSTVVQDPDSFHGHADFQLDELWRTDDPGQPRYLASQQMEMLTCLIDDGGHGPFQHADLTSLAAALRLALDSGKRIQIDVIPESRIEDRHWIIPRHCSNCIRPAMDWRGVCPHCGSRQPPRPGRKRQLRGDRPYWPLVRFLGPEATRRVAAAYFQPSGD